MAFQEHSDLAYELRKFALDQANRGSFTSMTSSHIPPDKVVERATTYYEFLRGKIGNE